ncbi:MAG: hypothetical protein ACFFFC_00060 [Candidatus Thorarchaeota archaeon]
MINKAILDAFVNELEKISQLIAPASLPKGTTVRPRMSGLPAPAQLVKGNVKYVPWELSATKAKAIARNPARLSYIAKKVIPVLKKVAA